MDCPPVYIMRHGQTEWNAARRLHGRLDSRLTAIGRAQALAQQKIMQTIDLTGFRAYSSPQGRAFHSASLVLDGLLPEIHTDVRLREIDVGQWQGNLVSEVASEPLPEDDEQTSLYLSANAPGGESLARLRDRCTAFLQDLQNPAVIVTHGITSRMLRVVVLGLKTSEIQSLEGGQGTVFNLADGVQTKLSIGA